MKKVLNKILNIDKKTFLFLAIICIIGIITGSLFTTVLSTNDKEIVSKSLNDYINNISSIKISLNTFLSNFILNILYAAIIWILGISIIGLPIVIIIIFFKSFIISFSISSFIINYKAKGILYSLIYIFPHMIINLLIYIYLGVFSIKLSLSLIKAIINKKNIIFKNDFKSYFKLFFLCFLAILLTSLYETMLMPLLFKYLTTLL